MYQPECPEIPQGCFPGTWSGEPVYDTNRNLIVKNGYFFRLEEVKGLNSPDDEWQLSFVNDNSAIFTFSESGLNRPLFVRRLNESRFSIDKGLDGINDEHNGSFSIRSPKIAFTVSPNSNNDIKKYHNDFILASMVNIIGKSRIITAEINSGKLDKFQRLEFNQLDELDWTGHPAISPKGDIICFSSDMKGGYGGNDLWLIYKIANDKWSEPVNLGNRVNSKCDEITPHFSNDGKKLYFSSSGHSTVGGYDIFFSEIAVNLYSEISKIESNSDLSKYFSYVTNLGTPVNTEYDELFPSSPSEFDDIIYFSSNQNRNNNSLLETKGGFDLFVCYKVRQSKQNIEPKANDKNDVKIAIDNENKIEIKSPAKDITVKGKVFTKSNNKPIDSALISIKSDDEPDIDREIFTDKNGRFEFPINRDKQFDITAQKKEYFYDSKRVFVPYDKLGDTLDLNFYLPEIGEIRLNFPTDEYKNPYKFTLDSSGVETGRYWTEELKLVAKNIKLSLDKIDKIVLVGHTDDVGSDEYNIALGLRRVDFVANELIKLGIPSRLLFTRSAGEKEPLIKSENEEINRYRKRLRRVTMEKFFK